MFIGMTQIPAEVPLIVIVCNVVPYVMAVYAAYFLGFNSAKLAGSTYAAINFISTLSIIPSEKETAGKFGYMNDCVMPPEKGTLVCCITLLFVNNSLPSFTPIQLHKAVPSFFTPLSA